MNKGKVCIRDKWYFTPELIMKRLRVFLFPPRWDASPSQGYPSVKCTGTLLYTWVERDTVRVKCFAQEHNTTFPARTQTRTIRIGDIGTRQPRDLRISKEQLKIIV